MAKQYTIGGIAVEFPYKAYGPQLAYMGKVVATLEQSRLRKDGHCNALLESPTGSGKSLALLCATLAWQQHYKAILKSRPPSTWGTAGPIDSSDVLGAGGGFIPEDLTTGSIIDNVDGLASIQHWPGKATCQTEIAPKVPRIFYATRTHAQIKQVIREFRKTQYRVPMAILGSKTHYCTNKQVQKKKNVEEDCSVLLRGPEPPGCRNFKNVLKVKGHPSLQQGGCKAVHDIEDLVNIGHSVKGCAYFAARAMAMDAEIVFCPYSYIIDPIVREAVEADIRGSIIIFDEAHNIEDVAREAGSIDLETTVLLDLQLELQQLCTSEPTSDYYQPLLDMVEELRGWTEAQANNLRKLEFEHHSSWWTGDKAVQELRSAGIPLECFEVLSSCCRRAVAAASDDKTGHLSGHLIKSLERLFRVFQFMLCNNARRAVDYQLLVQKFVRNGKGLFAKQWIVTFSLWCLNPAVVFEEVAATSRSVIVTSGTLAPIESFSSELGVEFDFCIETPHVVDMGNQVWAAALSVGPREVVLNSSYKNAENVLFQDAIGAALLEIFKVTPDGVLVFFPSYKLLQKLCDRWESTGLWLLLAGQKQLFIEPRVNDEIFESVLQGYYVAISGIQPAATPTSKRTKGKANTLGPPGKSPTNGAALLAVCRGKVSEGIDFSDKNARAVVVVGIPFPNVKDIQVSLKKQYNSTHQVARKLLSGDQWYCQQAFRALNQAVGRCIRHRYDYGGIILLDERFKVNRNLEYMSKWLRKSIQQSNNFEASMGQLQDFFVRLREFDFRAQLGTPESLLRENLPELSIPGLNRVSSPITPKPITPFKSESGLLRVTNKLQLSILPKTAVIVLSDDESVLDAPCTRSGPLMRCDVTEPEPTPVFCFENTFAQRESSGVCGTDLEMQLLTQRCSSHPTPMSFIKKECADEDAQSFSLGKVLGEKEPRPGAPDAVCYSKETSPSVIDIADIAISIKDDDGSLYSSTEIFEDREELLYTALSTKWRPDSISASGRLNTGLCQISESRLHNSAIAFPLPEGKEQSLPKPADFDFLECTVGDEVACKVSHLGDRNIQSDPQCYPTVYCRRCGLAVGSISSSKIKTLQKSYLTSLLNSNRMQSQMAVGSTPVYFTDISIIKSEFTEERHPQSEVSAVHIGSCQTRQSGVWVEQDGCVFKPLVCWSCTNIFIGVHILAADVNNLELTGKVAIFVESVSFGLDEKSSEGHDDDVLPDNRCCQEPATSRHIWPPSKRTQTTQLAKGKLKLRKKEC